jgi:hypothetical protein
MRHAGSMTIRFGSIDSGSPPRRGRILGLLSERGSRFVSGLFVVAAVAMLPWVAFLGATLPPRYDAGHWNLLWVGFDVALVCVLGYAAWAAWFRRQILGSTTLVAGTLLLCDAWFDVITSIGHRDQWLTLLTAVGGELPLAFFFFWLYRRIVLSTLAIFHELLGDGPSPRRLREAQILFLPTRPPPASAAPRVADLGPDVFPVPDEPHPATTDRQRSAEAVVTVADKGPESKPLAGLGQWAPEGSDWRMCGSARRCNVRLEAERHQAGIHS